MHELPPGLGPESRVILFDGVCRLCNAWSRFIMRVDSGHRFQLASVQSPEGAAILRHFGFPTDTFETMLFVHGNRCFGQSTAFFSVMRGLGMPWRLLCVFELLPRGLRDWLYDRIALNRYRLFGRYDVCVLPDSDHEGRFLTFHEQTGSESP